MTSPELDPLRAVTDELGVFLRAEAIGQGYDDKDISRSLRAGVLTRVRHGSYVFTDTWASLTPGQRHVLLGRAVMRRVGGVALSHTTAALAHGLDVWDADLSRAHVTRLDGRAARWAAIQAGPKVLVATQTRVLEVVADPEGELVGSVPVVVVRPRDPARVWHLAAAITAPSASAWLLRRAAGTGRSPDACRPTAALLAALPLPVDAGAWDRAAALAERAQAGQVPVAEVAPAAELAYGSRRADVVAWWEQRRPQR